jgi:hypothetical protein
LGSNAYRVHSILNRANQYIDPVLLLLEDEKRDILHLRGSELVRAASGNVYKYYSPHGRWMIDEEDEKQSVLDHGNAQIYQSRDLTIGNGIVEHTPLQSMCEWLESRDEALRVANEALAERPKKMYWTRKSSPLQQIVSSLDDEELSHDSETHSLPTSPSSSSSRGFISISPSISPLTPPTSTSPESHFSIDLPSPSTLDITSSEKPATPPYDTAPSLAHPPTGPAVTDSLLPAPKHAPRKRKKRALVEKAVKKAGRALKYIFLYAPLELALVACI